MELEHWWLTGKRENTSEFYTIYLPNEVIFIITVTNSESVSIDS